MADIRAHLQLDVQIVDPHIELQERFVELAALKIQHVVRLGADVLDHIVKARQQRGQARDVGVLQPMGSPSECRLS